ncbi:MAG: thermonuclease family protein [Pseudomonadota bacterium]|nr:thermonuclease family protein [Pseudomonadota bacterium]
MHDMHHTSPRTATAWLSRCVALAVLALASASAGAQASANQAPWLARVSHVVDGDSIWVRPEGGGARTRVRLRGIDAPELCQPHGREARDALRGLTQGRVVRVTVHARDRWGRAIADVEVPGHTPDIAARMVAAGWAWSEGHGWRRGTYWQEQAEAQRAGRGLFASPAPETPADFRRRHGPCQTPRR